MRLAQIVRPDLSRAVVATHHGGSNEVPGYANTRSLALAAYAAGTSLAPFVLALGRGKLVDLAAVYADCRILAPVDHPDAAHCLATGTGLTHFGSADARDAMHRTLADSAVDTLTDSMKMFRLGVEGGKPEPGETGAQPEWFYKGDGRTIVAPGAALTLPSFASDGGEEPELAGVYVIAVDGTPLRIGFTLANEFSDHVMERVNYLYLAHSKLRQMAFGPELLVGELPRNLRGTSRVIRGENILWEGTFLTGEHNMCHSIANLEHHHFKYDLFRRPGDVHYHMFGTATLSFSDGVSAQAGDVFEIHIPEFGMPLRNSLAIGSNEDVSIVTL